MALALTITREYNDSALMIAVIAAVILVVADLAERRRK
jgi:hypothetical protein